MTYDEPSKEGGTEDLSSTVTTPIMQPDKPGGDRVYQAYAEPEYRSDDSADNASSEPLLTADEQQGMKSRWRSIQERFVDDPELAVEGADELVGEAILRLSEIFRDTRQRLEAEWGKGDKSTSTEELRQALRRYRTFFDRILAV